MICKTCESETRSLHSGDCPACANKAQRAWEKRMAVRLDASKFDCQRLVNYLLTQHWMHECEIDPNYMPPYPREDTRPTCQVHYRYPDGTLTGLRHSGGPLQGFFWDVYGDDFKTPELALVAISQAPAPVRIDFVVPTHGR